MTPGRQNEIWAMLDAESKEKAKKEFRRHKGCNSSTGNDYCCGYVGALIDFFGKHNLTMQAGEKLKEEETMKEREISEKFPIDYTQYRLDLTKELAVAGISHQIPPRDLNNFAEGVVIIADEIIKQLKETEI